MATVGYGNHELYYDAVMDAYQKLSDGEADLDECMLISAAGLPVEVPARDIYRIIDGINNGTADINPIPVSVRSYNHYGFIMNKDELDYEDLNTLESLLSYFKHDTSLDVEIANLKEQCLFNTIDDLESKTATLIREKNEADKRFKDAVMLMSYINPEDIPKDHIEHIINSAMGMPSLLLNYIDEDVELLWPVRKMVDGHPVMAVSHGLRTKDAADKEDA